MAISQQKLLQFLRSSVAESKAAAIEKLNTSLFSEGLKFDGAPLALRYHTKGKNVEGDEVKSLFVIFHQEADGATGYTIFDNADNAQADLAALQAEVDRVETAAGLAADGTYVKSADAKFVSDASSIKDAVEKLDAAIKASEVYSADQTVVITPMANGAGTDLSVNVDGKTIVIDEEGVLNAEVTLTYVLATTATEESAAVPAHLELKRADGKTVSIINVSDLIGNGVLDHSSYNKNNGMLSLFFKRADGTLKEEKIDLHEMLDINDMMIATGSTNYLNVVLDDDASESGKSQAVFSALIKKMAETSYAEGSVVTGLVDAADVKKYVDDKATDLAVTADGDDYVDASVDADNNKHVIVATNVENVSADAGTRGTWNISEAGEATLAGETAPSISGVEKTLMDGKQAIDAVKTYVDAKVAVEAAERAAKIEAAVKALDKTATETKGTNVHVTLSEVDGIASIDSVVEDYAEVQFTAPAEGKLTGATLVVKEGDVAKLVNGGDINSVKEYIDAKDAELKDSLTVVVTAETADVIDITKTSVVGESGATHDDYNVAFKFVDAATGAKGAETVNVGEAAGLVKYEDGGVQKLDVSFDFGEFSLDADTQEPTE